MAQEEEEIVIDSGRETIEKAKMLLDNYPDAELLFLVYDDSDEYSSRYISPQYAGCYLDTMMLAPNPYYNIESYPYDCEEEYLEDHPDGVWKPQRYVVISIN